MSKPVRRHTYGPKRRPFDHTLPLYVRKAFGEHRVGEVFPLAGATRVRLMRAAGLFSARFLTHSAPPPPAADRLGGFAALARIGAAIHLTPIIPPELVASGSPKHGKRPRPGV